MSKSEHYIDGIPASQFFRNRDKREKRADKKRLRGVGKSANEKSRAKKSRKTKKDVPLLHVKPKYRKLYK
jgi:hypothetical protein